QASHALLAAQRRGGRRRGDRGARRIRRSRRRFAPRAAREGRAAGAARGRRRRRRESHDRRARRGGTRAPRARREIQVMTEPARTDGGGAAASARGRVRLGPAEAAIFETFVVPRYLALFGELAVEMLVESPEAQVVHMHCRTGYPDRGMAMKLP